MSKRFLSIGCVLAMMLLVVGAANATTYTDNFDSGLQLPWSNQRGNWVAQGGVYYAQTPGNSPVTATLLPYDVTDFTAEVDINNVDDGGLWARANSDGTVGVMLILHGGSIYWHVITDPTSGPWTSYGATTWSYTTNVHVKLTADGDLLSAYLNGATTPITTLDLSAFEGYDSGRFGLYSNSGQTFDNVSLTPVPIPGAVWLLGSGLLSLIGLRRKFRK